MSRGKSEIELKVEEMKLQIKTDLDIYIKGCVSLQKNAVNYDNMVLENTKKKKWISTRRTLKPRCHEWVKCRHRHNK